MNDRKNIIDIRINLEKDYGFTPSGSAHYKNSVNDFANSLLQRAETIGKCSMLSNSPLEITHEHVTTAAHYIFGAILPPEKPSVILVTRIAEFLCAALVGAGGSNLGTTWGKWAFGFGFFAASIVYVVQIVKEKRGLNK